MRSSQSIPDLRASSSQHVRLVPVAAPLLSREGRSKAYPGKLDARLVCESATGQVLTARAAGKAQVRYGHELVYFEGALEPETCSLAAGFPVVSVFVNDCVDARVLGALVRAAGCHPKYGLQSPYTTVGKPVVNASSLSLPPTAAPSAPAGGSPPPRVRRSRRRRRVVQFATVR